MFMTIVVMVMVVAVVVMVMMRTLLSGDNDDVVYLDIDNLSLNLF